MSKIPEKTLRDSFKKRLQSKLFDRLAILPLLEDWKPTDIWNLSKSLCEAHDMDINGYLDAQKITLRQVDLAINKIIEQMLLPDLDKITI